jgi:hypothetical protein
MQQQKWNSEFSLLASFGRRFQWRFLGPTWIDDSAARIKCILSCVSPCEKRGNYPTLNECTSQNAILLSILSTSSTCDALNKSRSCFAFCSLYLSLSLSLFSSSSSLSFSSSSLSSPLLPSAGNKRHFYAELKTARPNLTSLAVSKSM